MSDRGRQVSEVDNEFARAAAGVGSGFDQIFSIRDYISGIWNRWLLFVIALVLGVTWSFYYEMTAPKMYTVTLYVSPVGDAPTAGSSISGLVSIFTGGTQAVGPPDWNRYVFALTSVELADKLEREHHLIKGALFASLWDEKTKSWRPLPGWDSALSRFFNQMFGLPPEPTPSVTTLQSYLIGNVFLATDKTSGLTTLTMRGPDPKKVLAFLLMVHSSAVDLIREEISSRNTAKIDYLTRALGTTANADQRGVLIGMLAQTEQTQMLLNNHLPFAAQIIDTPTVPAMPSSPSPLFVALTYRVGVLVFLILMLIAVDQMAGTNFAVYLDAKIRRTPHSIAMRISRFREYGWQGVFSRSS